MVANPQTNEGQRVLSGTAESRPSLSDAKQEASSGEPWRTNADLTASLDQMVLNGFSPRFACS